LGLAGAQLACSPAAAAPPLPGQENQSFYSGGELLRSCGHEAEFTGGVCFGMVAGLVWAGERFDICAIEGLTTGQATDIVVRFLADHPEMQQQIAQAAIVAALQHEFPCKPN
jgi:hypothetical protein